MQEIGAELRKARLWRGLGLRELAGRVQVSPSYLSLLERGLDSCSSPSEGLLRALAGELELEPDELCRRFGRVPAALERWLLARPSRVRALRRVASQGLELELHQGEPS